MRTERMEAGRELDALVAERVMGAAWIDAADPACQLLRDDPEGNTLAVRERATGRLIAYGEAWDDSYLPAYSTDIAAAWEVVEAPAFITGEFVVSRTAGDEYFAEYIGILSGDKQRGHAYADTAPLAICRAALAASTEPGSER